MKALMRLLLSLIALLPVRGSSQVQFGHESDDLTIEIMAYDAEANILTLRITNSDSDSYVLPARSSGPPPLLGQPEFWFIFHHPHPNIEWSYEDARKGSWDASKHSVTLAPGATLDCRYYLDGFRQHVQYWFYDPKSELRFRIANRIEPNAAGQPATRSESK
jgi:hypothetical protein